MDISDRDLEGELDLSEYTCLEKLDCSGNEITRLNVSKLVKLKELNCNSNQLTNLDLRNLTQLKELYCRDNYLTNINYPNSSKPEKLTVLSIRNNNFGEQDLAIFSDFTNLEELWIGNDDKKRIERGIYNRFIGSLESLKNLTKLKSLHISNTDISGNLEHLSSSLEEINCSSKEKPASKVKKIEEKIRADGTFLLNEQNGNYYKTREAQKWLDWSYLREERKKIDKLELNYKGLEGFLIIKNLPKLRIAYFSNNHLKKLTISNCPEISELYVKNNSLVNLEFLDNLNIEKLTHLDLSLVQGTCFPSRNLSFLSKFPNLETLELNDNHCLFGSFKPLQNMHKLENLWIANIGIETGLEYLPENLKWVNFYKQEEEKKGKIWQELQPFVHTKGPLVESYNFQQWREANPCLIEKVQLENVLDKLKLALIGHIIRDEIVRKGLKIFIFQTEERIIELKKEIEQIKKQQLQAQIESFPKNYFL